VALEARLTVFGSAETVRNVLPRFSAKIESPMVRFVPIEAGDWELDFHRGGEVFTTSVRVRPDETTSREIDFSEAFDVRGRVVDVDGNPVPEAFVTFLADSRPVVSLRSKASHTRTDASGGFALRGLVGPGHLSVHERSLGEAKHPLGPSGGSEQDVVITLRAGARISGVVLGPDRAPISFAKVTAERVGTIGSTQTGTDAEGYFSVLIKEPGRIRLTATALPDIAAAVELDLQAEEHHNGLVIFAGQGAIVSGVVLGLPPEELAHTRVEARCGSAVARFSTTPAWTGEYVIDGLPTATCTVGAVAGDGRGATSGPIEVVAPYNHGPIDLVVAGRSIRGRIVSAGTSPAGAEVRASSAPFRTKVAPNGDFKVLGVSERAGSLALAGGLAGVVLYPAGSDDLDLGAIAISLGSVAVRVLGPESAPLSSTSLILRRADDPVGRQASARTDADGWLRVPRIEAGVWLIEAGDMKAELVVTPGATTNGTIEIDL
jgi:hypothetical protein